MELLLLLGLGSLALAATISSDDEDDLILLEGGEDLSSGDGDDVITTASTLDAPVSVDAGEGDDLVQIDGGDLWPGSTVAGGDGADTIEVSGYSEIYGDAGDDEITGAGLLDGGDGDDHIIASEDESDMIGGAGDDTLEAADFYTGEVLGGDGNDEIALTVQSEYGFDTIETISGGDGDDLISVTAVTDLATYDESEDTYDFEGAYAYTVQGGGGADTFEIHHEIDTMTGPQNDETWLNPVVSIGDFDPAEDTLLIYPDQYRAEYSTVSVEVEETGSGSYSVLLRYDMDSDGNDFLVEIPVTSSGPLSVEDIHLVSATA